MPTSRHDVVIVGAGQAGLAMSRCLSRRGVDHVLLERRSVASAWVHDRWDSLRLLTPNWMSRLPDGERVPGHPDGFAPAGEFARHLRRYAQQIAAPVVANCAVESIENSLDRWKVTTPLGAFLARSVVLATGPGTAPRIPPVVQALHPSIRTMSALEYKNPAGVEDGLILVVGASASGVQIADELARSGRDVVMAVGEHVRAVRAYRGRDLYWWLDRTGMLDDPYDAVDDLERVRSTPSFQLVGSDERYDVDVNSLQARGVRLAGRLVGSDQRRVTFSGSLANACTSADLKLERLLGRFDEFAAAHDGFDDVGEPSRPARSVVTSPCFELPLSRLRTVICATGYRPTFPAIHAPVFDRRGRLRHDGGEVAAPGMFVLGLPFLRRRRSSFIDGVAGDADVLAERIRASLDRRRDVA